MIFQIAEEEQATFTELVRLLTMHCMTDLQKARYMILFTSKQACELVSFSINFP